MHIFRTIVSTTLALLVVLANLITLCPADEGHISDMHLLIDPCETHACHRGEIQAGCDDELCEHQVCSDKPMLGAFQVISPVDANGFLNPAHSSSMFSLRRSNTLPLPITDNRPRPAISPPILVLRV